MGMRKKVVGKVSKLETGADRSRRANKNRTPAQEAVSEDLGDDFPQMSREWEARAGERKWRPLL
jgi:hypothetical protein